MLRRAHSVNIREFIERISGTVAPRHPATLTLNVHIDPRLPISVEPTRFGWNKFW